MDLGLLILQWKQQDRMVEFHREVKKCPFLKLNCAIMEKEQNFILGLDKFQTAQRTQKKKIHFRTVPQTFLRLGHPVPKFRQTCTITQKQVLFRDFKCDFWIPHAKHFACTNF